jgi:hypothetical protein
MANQNFLTYGAKVSEIEQMYFTPVAVTTFNPSVPIGTLYCFLSKVTPWAANNVPVPTQDQKSIKQIFKNMFVAKLITPSNISPVVQRIDWTANTVYQFYRDDIDMFATNPDNTLVNQFYVKNRYDQVFKCLWNDGGDPSTQEPYFQPGQYNTDNIYYGNDGYKWKYIYTIDTGSKVKFMDANWIPVSIGQNTPNPVVAAGLGSIDVINVTSGGTGYDAANNPITITVVGDGTGATAQVGTVTGGVIQDVVVITPGSGYTQANVVISSSNNVGSGATAIAPASPIGGHGFDAVSELGCFNVMVTCEFDGTENTTGTIEVPTNDGNGNPIEYYQMGVVINPTTNSLYPNPANGAIYKTTTDIVVASAPDTGFVSSETVYQGASLATASFTATVLNFELATNLVHLINIQGTPATNQPLKGTNSGAVRTVLNVQPLDWIVGSGYISYIENLTGIQRSQDGKEQFKIVLSY